MIKLLLVLLAGIFIEKKWSPRLEYLSSPNILILHYNGNKNKRERKIFQL